MINWLILAFLGAVWGLHFSVAKIAADAGGEPFGIAFWQSLLAGVGLWIYLRMLRKPTGIRPRHFTFIFLIALLGTLIPGVVIYWVAGKIDAGILAITISLVPILTYLFAVPLGLERAVARRVLGIVVGIFAVGLLVLPESSLPDRASVAWVLVACVAPVSYAVENIAVDLNRPIQLGAVALVCAANLLSAAILLPLVLATGQFIVPSFPPGELEASIAMLGVGAAAAYSLFVHLIRQAGPVFASQSGYLVTLCGVFWGIAIFGETHTAWVWSALAAIIFGVFLVTPRPFDNEA